MFKRHPCGGVDRRQFLAGAAASVVPLLTATSVSASQKPEVAKTEKTAAKVVLGDGSLGLPGPYPGRVVEVKNPSMIRKGVKNREAVKGSIAKGLTALTGADDGNLPKKRRFRPWHSMACCCARQMNLGWILTV